MLAQRRHRRYPARAPLRYRLQPALVAPGHCPAEPQPGFFAPTVQHLLQTDGNKLSVGSAICARFQNPLRGNLNFAWETTKALRELSVKNQVRTPH